MFEDWNSRLSRPLHLRDGRVLQTLDDARMALTSGWRTSLNSDDVSYALGLLDEAAHIGGSHLTERATNRAHVALMRQRQI